jgi:hypothetical protein
MHADRTPEAGDGASEPARADGRGECGPVDAEPLCGLGDGEPLGRGCRGEEQGAREVGGGHLLRHRRHIGLRVHERHHEGGRGLRRDGVAEGAQSSHSGGRPISQRLCAGFNWTGLPVATVDPLVKAPRVMRACIARLIS